MGSPMFGDIGEAHTDENGECYLFIDDIFKETITTSIEYQVFLQKEGQGDIWVAEQTEEYFVVKGTPNLKFAWEIKAKQREYEHLRMEVSDQKPEVINPDYETSAYKNVENTRKIQENHYDSLALQAMEEQDYESEASQMVDSYYKGLEGAFI